ncbi:MAG: hypothetical protein GXY77_01645 [Fibrobacter sp.]|nr:hypothetical protein [Fibrobacter sp.]
MIRAVLFGFYLCLCWIDLTFALDSVTCFFDTPEKMYLSIEEQGFVVLGHLYPVIDDSRRVNALFQSINNDNPSCVFVLGDCGAWDSLVAKKIRNSLTMPVFFAPGNQDLDGERKKKYERAIGYLNCCVLTKKTAFYIANTSVSGEKFCTLFNNTLQEIQPDLDIVLLGHHRIWDDLLLSSEPYMHDKSYLFKDVYYCLRNRVKVIFSGNSNSQYFDYLPTNTNTVFWSDVVGGIKCYSCGMGFGDPRTTYVYVKSTGKEYAVFPRSVVFGPDTIITINPESKGLKEVIQTKMVFKVLRSKQFWAGIITGVCVCLCFGILFLYGFRKW